MLALLWLALRSVVESTRFQDVTQLVHIHKGLIQDPQPKDTFLLGPGPGDLPQQIQYMLETHPVQV